MTIIKPKVEKIIRLSNEYHSSTTADSEDDFRNPAVYDQVYSEYVESEARTAVVNAIEELSPAEKIDLTALFHHGRLLDMDPLSTENINDTVKQFAENPIDYLGEFLADNISLSGYLETAMEHLDLETGARK